MNRLVAWVDRGELAGAVTCVWRRGEPAEIAAVGWSDVAARIPLEPAQMFRIASMTKPITSLAALMLLEERRIDLAEPITRWAPELAAMRVLRSPDRPLDETEPATRDITFDDLLTHRSGLSYGDFWPGPIGAAYRTLGADIDSHLAPDAWIAALGALPLLAQPGESFLYGRSTDLLGLLLARIEGRPLHEVLARRIFEPLGMHDTGFTVAADKRARCAGTYGFDVAGRLEPRATGPSGSFLAERPAHFTFCSAGQGLWSTASDYLRFARLFIEGGAVDGVRLVQPETIARMMTNQLTVAQRERAELFGLPLFGRGHGFGLGVAVILDPAAASPALCAGSAGTVGWPGAFGGFWSADPGAERVLVFLAHQLVEPEQLMQGIGLGIHEAIAAFQAAAR